MCLPPNSAHDSLPDNPQVLSIVGELDSLIKTRAESLEAGSNE
jgi:hypothetical protein